MTMSIDAILLATNELRDTCPDLQIESVVPAFDGVCFKTTDGYTYKYEYISGCIYRSYKTDWRTKTPKTLIKRSEG